MKILGVLGVLIVLPCNSNDAIILTRFFLSFSLIINSFSLSPNSDSNRTISLSLASIIIFIIVMMMMMMMMMMRLNADSIAERVITTDKDDVGT